MGAATLLTPGLEEGCVRAAGEPLPGCCGAGVAPGTLSGTHLLSVTWAPASTPGCPRGGRTQLATLFFSELSLTPSTGICASRPALGLSGPLQSVVGPRRFLTPKPLLLPAHPPFSLHPCPLCFPRHPTSSQRFQTPAPSPALPPAHAPAAPPNPSRPWPASVVRWLHGPAGAALV